jgi:predicted TIM-barrel enzyme
MAPDFKDIFTVVTKPIIGMIHLAGDSPEERIERALQELRLYDEEGINGAIIEDYHGTPEDVKAVSQRSASLNLRLVRGINLLRLPYNSFILASDTQARFVQFDSVQTNELESMRYEALRRTYSEIAVFGGIRFKYTSDTGNPLEQDLREGMRLCEAIVTTGEGTGIETPIEKLRTFKEHLGKFPLIVGAGVTTENIHQQLQYSDGAIIGSYFKPNKDTALPVDRQRVRSLMNIVKDIRAKL